MINQGAFPDSLTDPKVKKHLEDFFRISNASNPSHPDEGSEEAFAQLFTQDGVYHLASKDAKGHKDIIEMRKALFAHIPHRDHRANRFYTFGANQLDIMAQGDVSYKHHHGHEKDTIWAARFVLKQEGNDVKFSLVQITVDTAAHT